MIDILSRLYSSEKKQHTTFALQEASHSTTAMTADDIFSVMAELPQKVEAL